MSKFIVTILQKVYLHMRKEKKGGTKRYIHRSSSEVSKQADSALVLGL